MSAEDTIRKLFDAMNAHDVDAFIANYAPDAVSHSPEMPEPLQGRDAIRGNMEGFFQAFPDMKVEIVNLMSQGNTALMEVSMTGTNTGPMQGPQGEMPPTNRRVELRGAGVSVVNDEGLVTEERQYFDTMAMMAQLGLMGES